MRGIEKDDIYKELTSIVSSSPKIKYAQDTVATTWILGMCVKEKPSINIVIYLKELSGT